MNIRIFTLVILLSLSATGIAQDLGRDTLLLEDVVVTGTRNTTDIRHLPQTVTVVGRDVLTANERMNILPTLMEQVPGLMLTSRGVLGYGVSSGGSGGMMLRGISSGSGEVMVLIDGQNRRDIMPI